MFTKLFLTLVLFPGFYTYSQTVRHPASSPYTGLVAYSSSQADVFSISANPAALAQIKNSSAGIYSEKKYLLSDVNYYTAAAGLLMKAGRFGAQVAYSGFGDFNETRAGISYARKLSATLDAGVQFNYYTIKIMGYGSSSIVNFAIGYMVHITDKIHVGMQACNPFGGKFENNENEKLPSEYSLGLGYETSPKFFISAQIDKEEDLPVGVNAGFQYKFLPQLMVRAGIESETATFYVGIGYTIKSLRIDMITSYHPLLGITPGMLFIFNFKQGTE